MEGSRAKIILEKDGLKVVFVGTDHAYDLLPTLKNRFNMKGPVALSFRFAKDQSGKITHLILTGAGGGVKYKKVK